MSYEEFTSQYRDNLKKFEAKMASEFLQSELIQAARDYQQNHYELCADWNSFDRYQLEYLRDYIGYGMFGPPLPQEDDTGDKLTDANANKSDSSRFAYNEKQREAMDSLYDKVMEYSNFKENKHTVHCSIVYNVIFNKKAALEAQKKRFAELTVTKNINARQKKDKDEKTECSEPELQFFPVPVFKVKWYSDAKTDGKNAAAGKSGKVYFIDNSGRVYAGFADYLENNTLPKCTMVLPKDGVYQIDPNSYNGEDLGVSQVWLEILPSPADSPTKKVLLGGDIASTIFTTAGMAVGITAMFTPVGAGLAIASAVGTGVSGLWTAGRSAQQLADRGLHGESINVTDRAALGAWIGIAGSTVGVAATGGAALLSRAIRTGTSIGRVATVTYDAVQIGNLIVNGIGIGYKSYDIYATWSEKKEISPQDVFFFVTHLFFFCNAVVNVRLAHTLIETSQAQVLKDYEASLRSNRHRREFQRMARNTRAAGPNDVSSNEEIIRGINMIDNKDEFFQSMVRNRKAFSASGAKASFSDGKVSVNSLLTIDPIEFSKLPKEIRADIIKGVSSVSTDNSAGTATSGLSSTERINVTGATANMAGTKPKASTGAEPKVPTGAGPKAPTGAGPKAPTGAEPKAPTGAGPKAPTGAGSKAPTGAEPKAPAGAEPKAPTGAGSKAPTGAGSKAPTGAEPKAPTGAGSKAPTGAEPKAQTGTEPKVTSAVKPNNVAGTEPKNSVAPKTEQMATKVKNRPNETSYKNIDTSNGTILREFCMKHSSATMQTAPPQIADFQNVLNDLRVLPNCAVIFCKLLDIAYRIYVALPRNKDIAMGKLLGLIADYLWDVVKAYMRKIKPGCLVDDPTMAPVLDTLMAKLFIQVVDTVDGWVVGFKQWLEERFPQKYRL